MHIRKMHEDQREIKTKKMIDQSRENEEKKELKAERK